MTKFKEYLRAHDVPLECDYEVLPCEGVEHVRTSVLDSGVVATTCTSTTEAWSIMYNKHGECIVFKSYDDVSDLLSFCYGPEYSTWLHDMGYTSSEARIEVMRFMYCNDTEVRMAFKHMKAGIMDEEVFRKWHVKRCLEYVGIL